MNSEADRGSDHIPSPYKWQQNKSFVMQSPGVEVRNIKTDEEHYNSEQSLTRRRKASPSYSPTSKGDDYSDENFPSKRRRKRKFSSCSSSTTSTVGQDCEPVSSPQVFKAEFNAEFKEKIGNKPVDNCGVCGDLAVAHMHYGGVCCYSCKAFFRRATQTGKDKKYRCKASRSCDVTNTNRRSCQFCRFNKCLRIGMKPNWVLSDEQCNIRFRKVRKEKTNTEEEEEVHVIKVESSPINQSPVMPFTLEETRTVQYMIDCYNLSKETYVFSEQNDILFRRLFQGSEASEGSSQKYDYSRFDVGSLIMTVIKKNVFFVTTIDKFEQVSVGDKTALLKKNMTEMCHLRGAIRFDVKSNNFVWYFSKKDELQITFEKSNNRGIQVDGAPRENKFIQNALIGQQDISKFYKDTTTKHIFAKVSKLCEIGLPMEAYLILIHIVLFSSDNIELEDKHAVEKSQTHYLLFLYRYLIDLCGTEVARMRLSQIMGCLVELRDLCEKSQSEQEKIKL